MFDKNEGVHVYINIKNLLDLIAEDERSDDNLKRILHRLQTYFVGHSKIINDGKFGYVEKYTSGRSHIVFKYDDENPNFFDSVLELTVKLFIFNNKIFNNLSKYNAYTNFSVHAGMDFGDYYEYLINENLDDEEFTTIGGVANNSAKIQSYAPKDYVYITKKMYNKLSSDFKDKFIELNEDEKGDFNEKIRSSKFYKVHYKNIFSDEKLIDFEESLDKVKERVESEANGLNLKDITFESSTKQLSFDGLSLKGKNKKLDNACVMCADIRGFTKLFQVSDQNLDDLKEVMEVIYKIMNDVNEQYSGSRVQFQGDRILAIYNDFIGSEDAILRMLKSALSLNSKIQELNQNEYFLEKLNQQKISIGIGCSIGKVIATRLGLNGNKHNMLLSEAYKFANKSEDIYAESNEIVIWKMLKEEIDNKVDKTNSYDYQALQEVFSAISKTGFYVTSTTEDEFNSLVQEKEALGEIVDNVFRSEYLHGESSRTSNVRVDPWRKSL